MLMDLTVDALEYLHDAGLHGVEFDSSTPTRSVSFTATYHADCGSKKLDGRSICVVADDVTLLRAEVHGAIVNQEEIDYCQSTVSNEAEQILQRGADAGMRRPRLSMRLVLHSGSWWEIVCESIVVKFVEVDGR
jgi:hypothetical protein